MRHNMKWTKERKQKRLEKKTWPEKKKRKWQISHLFKRPDQSSSWKSAQMKFTP